MLERGHIATMYHKGSDSYAECVVLRPLSKAEVHAEQEAASNNTAAAKTIMKEAAALKRAPGDAGGVRRALAEVVGADRALIKTIYNDVNKEKTLRRLKVYATKMTTASLAKFRIALQREFGNRVVEVGHTPVNTSGGYSYGPGGGELFVRLKVSK